MINASEKAGYKAYFAAVRFSDGTGHALVSFKSTFSGYASWYFFEPQTNDLLTPEGLAQELNKNMGKIVIEVNIYGYFDDANDNDNIAVNSLGSVNYWYAVNTNTNTGSFKLRAYETNPENWAEISRTDAKKEGVWG